MIYTLPSVAERRIADYLRDNYTGSYTIQRAFTVAEYVLPLVLVKVGKLDEIEPSTHVYGAELSVSVHTQIDDVEDPETAHDNALQEIYVLMSDTEALLAAVNATGGRFHLHSYYCTGYDQETGGSGEERALTSVLSYKIFAQTLEA